MDKASIQVTESQALLRRDREAVLEALGIQWGHKVHFLQVDVGKEELLVRAVDDSGAV